MFWDIRDRWVRQALQDALPQKEHGGLWRGRGDISTMRIAGLQDVDILARCEAAHNVHARELDFPVKGDLVGREVTMDHFFKFSMAFK